MCTHFVKKKKIHSQVNRRGSRARGLIKNFNAFTAEQIYDIAM